MASPSLLSAYHASLQRAREAFHLTLDRLRQPGIDPGNELNKTIAEVIEDVDERLASDSMSPTNNRKYSSSFSFFLPFSYFFPFFVCPHEKLTVDLT